MFYLTKPNNFLPTYQIVICYCIHNDEILVLRRQQSDFQGGIWTAPGGKQEINETPLQGIKRELFEETGISIDSKKFVELGLFYIQNNSIDFIIRIFKTILDSKPENIVLSPSEHDQYEWLTKEQIIKLPLIHDGDQCLLNTLFNKEHVS